MSTEPPAIQVEGLSSGYEDTLVLENVSFAVDPAEILFIIGPSGCGKTTLLRAIVGLIEPEAGEVRFHGTLFDRDPARRRQMLRSFGMAFQSGALWSSRTLAENLALPLQEYTRLPRKQVMEIAAFKLSQVGLAGFGDRYPSELSGGMRVRAGLARALALDPRIVFFDEPTTGLDPIAARSIDELILRVRDTFGTTLVVVSHDVDAILGIGDRAILLDRGTRGIVAQGSPRELAAGPPGSPAVEFLTTRMVRPR